MARLKWFQFLVLSVFLFAGFQVQALEKFFRNSAGEQLIAFQQNQIWFVKVIRLNANRWPELVEEKQYQDWLQVENLVQQGRFVADLSAALEITPSAGFELRENSAVETSEGEVLWKAENQWSWDWEVKYAEWLQNHVDVEFFKKYNIKTDCADVQYYLRWIFSRIYKLPMASRLPGGGYLTQNSMKAEWEKLPTHEVWHKDKRFLAAMVYLTRLVYTHTLYRDSYPVELNATALLPGAFYLTISGKSGHTMVIYRQTPATSGVRILVMSSTVPREVRVLSSHRPVSGGYAAGKAAMLRMRWPRIANGQVSLVDEKKMPYYSTQQFELQDPNINRILNPNPNWDVEYDDAVQLVSELLKQRKIAVQDGYKICFPNKCDPAGSDWDNHSTPSRDRRIREALSYFDYELATEYSRYAERSEKEIVFEYEGEGYNLKNLRYLFEMNHPSIDPNHSLERRWPLGPKRFIQAISERLIDSLKSRREKIQKSNQLCRVPQNCAVETEAFKSLNLHQIVYEILSYPDHLNQYSSFYPNQKNLFDSVKKTSFFDGVSEQSFEQWMHLLRFSSHDPRSKPEHKEGNYEDSFVRLKLEPSERIYDSTKSGFIFVKKSDEYILYQIRNQQLMIFHIVGPEEKIKDYDTKTEEVLVCISGGCAFYNYNTKQKIFDLPNEFVGDHISIVRHSEAVVAIEYVTENSNPYKRNIKVYDLKKKKIIFSLANGEKIANFSISKDLKLCSYSIYADDFLSAQKYLLDLQKPNQVATEIPFFISLDGVEDYVIGSRYLFTKVDRQMVLFDLNDSDKNIYLGLLSSTGRTGILSKNIEDKYNQFYQVSFDEKSMRFYESEITDLTRYKFTQPLNGEQSVLYFFSSNSNHILEIDNSGEKIDYRVSVQNEVVFKTTGSYTTYAKLTPEGIKYQIRHATKGPVTGWTDSYLDLHPLINHPDTYAFKSYSEKWYHYIYLINQPQVSLLNLYFELTTTGLLHNSNEIWLLK